MGTSMARLPRSRPRPLLREFSPVAVEAPSYRVGFFLLALLTASLFVRPAELYASLEGFPLFQILIVACLLASIPPVVRVLSRPLTATPVISVTLGLLPAAVFSHIFNGYLEGASNSSAEMLKVLTYFVLIVALIDTPARMEKFLKLTALLVLVMGTIALLSYFDIVRIEAIKVLVRRDNGIDEETGQGIALRQLQALGLFADPNDFALVVVTALLVCVHALTAAPGWILRAVWVIPLGVLAVTFALTRSRGGFISLLVGLVVWVLARIGWRRALPIIIIGLPVIFVLFAGRQTNLNLDKNDTAGSRVRLWRDGLTMFKHAPLFGVGHNGYVVYATEVAHNSFLHTYAEMGFVGGTLFFCLFYLPLRAGARALRRRGASAEMAPPDFRPLSACIVAIVAAYGAGLVSLSRPYAASSYLVFGAAAAWYVMLGQRAPDAVDHWSPALVRTILSRSLLWLILLYVFIRYIAK